MSDFTHAIIVAATCISVLGLSGCASSPDLEGSISDRALAAQYPELVPLDTLVAQAGETAITEQVTTGLEARAAALRARAARLSRPVIDAPTRARLLAAHRRLGQ